MLRSGEDEAPGPEVGVDRPFHGAQHLRRGLPLVQQDGFGEAAGEGRVWVGPEHRRLRRTVEAHHRPGVSDGGRGLAHRSGPNQYNRR